MSWFFFVIVLSSIFLHTIAIDYNNNLLTPVMSTSEKTTHDKHVFEHSGKEIHTFATNSIEKSSLFSSNNDFNKDAKEKQQPHVMNIDSPPIFPHSEKISIKTIDDEPIESSRCVNETQYDEIEFRCYGEDLLEIPQNLTESLMKLTIVDAYIAVIGRDSLVRYKNALMDITLGNMPKLRIIEKGTFANIQNLRTVYITQAPNLKTLDGLLDGVSSDRFSNLRILQTGLVDVSKLVYEGNIMDVVDLDSNKIQKIQSNSIRIKAVQLTMNFNEITSIEDYAFNGSQIGKLHFNGNKHLRVLHDNAFAGMQSLHLLDLSSTYIEKLPIAGLSELEELRIERTPSLKTIPSIYDLGFQTLKKALLTHSFHCCAFKYPQQHHPEKHAQFQKCFHDTGQITTTPKPPILGFDYRKKRNIRRIRDSSDESREDDSNWGDTDATASGVGYVNFLSDHFYPDHGNLTKFAHINPLRGTYISHQEAKQSSQTEESDGYFHPGGSAEIKEPNVYCGKWTTRTEPPAVECSPRPDALNPCEDIMGSSWLRISVWFVVVLSVVGNLAVIIVVLFSGTEINVSRFLICNLAFADFCMGLYLLLIACMDLHSVGTYFNFAFDWQYGLGCQMSGFLTVFASHLSIYTLTVVTLERWFAITYAIHLTRRIRIGAAAKIMVAGWIYSVLVAALPVLGVSNYSSTSICLPMEVNTVVDKAYLYAIIIVNGLAFILIVVCYLQIYLSLGYETRRSNTKGEMTIAKKMALLIFTDFATWAPIAFFGLTALAGYPLIGVTRSKILLVFFYPLNACANPYLYALMTAQYRKDFYQMVSRIGIWKKKPGNYTVTTALRTSSNLHPVPLLAKSNGNCHHVKSDLDDTYV